MLKIIDMFIDKWAIYTTKWVFRRYEELCYRNNIDPHKNEVMIYICKLGYIRVGVKKPIK